MEKRTPPGPLGGPLKKTRPLPRRPVGRTIEKRTPPCPLGKQLLDSVEAKQYKRPDMNKDLRLGFASNDFAGTKWKNLTGAARWSDGTEMVTLDYSRLTSVLWGVCQARLEDTKIANKAEPMALG